MSCVTDFERRAELKKIGLLVSLKLDLSEKACLAISLVDFDPEELTRRMCNAEIGWTTVRPSSPIRFSIILMDDLMSFLLYGLTARTIQ
jgi:hypothetical protein